MNRKRKLILGITLVLVITVLTAWPNITNSSLKNIVKRTLEIALVEKKLPDYELLNKEDSIILSSENIDPETIPKIPGVNSCFPVNRSKKRLIIREIFFISVFQILKFVFYSLLFHWTIAGQQLSIRKRAT